jgi:hypothetical protein
MGVFLHVRPIMQPIKLNLIRPPGFSISGLASSVDMALNLSMSDGGRMVHDASLETSTAIHTASFLSLSTILCISVHCSTT